MLLSQQIADQNQKINQVMEQMKEMEKQKSNVECSTPNFVILNNAKTGGNSHSGSKGSGEVQYERKTMHFNPKVEFPTFAGSNPRNWVMCTKYFSLFAKFSMIKRLIWRRCITRGRLRFASVLSSYTSGRKHVVWVDFIVDLYARFQGDMGRQVVEEFNKLQKIGGLDDHIGKFEEHKALLLLKNPSLPNEYFVESFTGGLKPSI